MGSEIDYKSINKASWNLRTESHLKSEFYDNETFVAGRNSLNSIELELLGDIKDKKILHLQCHFGQDSISLTRLGAKVTAVDFSDKAIEAARELASKSGQHVEFICADVYELSTVLNTKFDLIFTSYGVLGWLPSMERWAAVVQNFLKPEGEIILVEFHPFLWMFDDDFNKISYDYQNSAAIVDSQEGTYADQGAPITVDYVSWNHGLSEVFSALISKAFKIISFQEFDYSPYPCFKETIEFEPGKYKLAKFDAKIPMVYALKAQLME